jgi:hypothetical protein
LRNIKSAILSATLITLLTLISCKSDDGSSCTVCQSDQTAAFDVCRDGNGNASVNGENTGTDYDVYVADLIAAGANCGG